MEVQDVMNLTAFAKHCGLSRAAIYEKMRNGVFPDGVIFKKEGKRGTFVKVTEALKAMSRQDPEQTLIGTQAQKKLSKPKSNEHQNAPYSKQKQAARVGVQNKNVSQPNENQKPEKESINSKHEPPKTKIAIPKSLTWNGELGIYMNDNVEIREIGSREDHIKAIYPVDAYQTATERYQISKANNEALKERDLALRVAEKEGRLVDAEKVKKLIMDHVTATKEAILNVPDQIGPELLACQELVELQTKLTEGLNDALASFSIMLKKMDKKKK